MTATETPSKLNWVPAVVCTLVTIVIARPSKLLSLDAMNWIVSLGPLTVFLLPPILASLIALRFTHVKNWGLVFLVFWMMPFVNLLIFGFLYL